MLKKAVARTKTAGRVKNFRATINEIRDRVRVIEHKLEEPKDDRLEKLRIAYKKVDPYQPLYGVTGFGDSQRGSRDRADAIFTYFSNNVAGMRFLDIGCYFGYLSFYLADRGAHATGWDYWENNIEVCNRLKDINGIPANFKYEKFGLDAIAKIQPGQQDVALILSVLHWTVHEEGLEYVQDCMAQLMEKVPILVVELAQKGEGKFFWDKAAPKRDLDIFNKVDDIRIEKIGDFPTHLSDVKRPLYVVSKNTVTVNNRKYLIEKESFRAYEKAPAWRSIASKYYISGGSFIKQASFADSTGADAMRVLNEVNFYLQRKQNAALAKLNLPILEDYEIEHDGAKLVFKRLDGTLLSELDRVQYGATLAEKIAKELLGLLSLLEKEGYHHNDLRSWNIMLSKQGKISLIDFELVAPHAEEDEFIALGWVVNTALTGGRENTDRRKRELPPQENFEKSTLLKQLYAELQTQPVSFADIRNRLVKTSSGKSKKAPEVN